jgi:hypothetical protein
MDQNHAAFIQRAGHFLLVVNVFVVLISHLLIKLKIIVDSGNTLWLTPRSLHNNARSETD